MFYAAMAVLTDEMAVSPELPETRPKFEMVRHNPSGSLIQRRRKP